MPWIFSLADLGNFVLEDDEEDDKLEPAEDSRLRMPPLITPATVPDPSADPSPLPALRFLPGTEKGDVEAGLLVELCLLSAATT